jgi:dihydrofolate reductase
MSVTLVVAMARNRVIGKDNQLPWHLPEDLKHFKALTTGHCLIMGRKTCDSIGRALPNRRTIVITRQADWALADCQRATSLVDALRLARQSHAQQAIFIVGGAQIYAQALEQGMANRVVVTQIEIEVDGDAFFPALDEHEWAVQQGPKLVSANGIEYRIQNYLKC